MAVVCPIRAALVCTPRLWHGGEGQLALIAQGLRTRGHQVTVLARRGGELARRLALEGFAVETFLGRGVNPLGWWKLRRTLVRLKPDLLFLNDPHALTAVSLAGYGLRDTVRLVARRVNFPIRNVARYQRGCDRVICVSQAVRQVCLNAGLPPSQLRLVHDGVDPARVRSGDRARGRRSLGLSEQQPLVLCVATLTDPKGHRYLLEALPAVVSRFPQLRVALAGDGDLTAVLQAQAKQLGLSGCVQFLGYRNDVPDLIQAADLMVIPSHMEGLCTSLIDALFGAKPIVATLAGGIPELVGPRDGEPEVARLVSPCDPQALAVALCEALANPDAMRLLAERGRLRAERLFTADRMVDQLLDVYAEVLAERQVFPS